jgi:hypothetical protein
MGNIERMPESLVQAYYEMVLEDLRERLQKDPDYQRKKGDGQFESLDKL